MNDYKTDNDEECIDEEVEIEDATIAVTNVRNNRTFRQRIEEYEESKRLRDALDDIWSVSGITGE